MVVLDHHLSVTEDDINSETTDNKTFGAPTHAATDNQSVVDGARMTMMLKHTSNYILHS